MMAFVIWGGWSYFVNQPLGHTIGIRAGLTQGTASFIITLCMVYAVTWLFQRIQRIKNDYLQLLLPAGIVVSFTGSTLVAVHSLMATPDIFKTVAPALTVAFIFCMFTAYKLQQQLLKR